MRQTIEALMNGDPDILELYERAREHWKQILQETEPFDDSTLGQRLLGEQFWFEQDCGEKFLGQEIMVVTGIAQFYSTAEGFAENIDKAVIVLNAFKKCASIEAECFAESVAKIYDLV
jgi:hypothetical protein